MKILQITLLVAVLFFLPTEFISAQTPKRTTMIKKSKSPADRNYEKAIKELEKLKQELASGKEILPYFLNSSISEVEKYVKYTLKNDANFDVSAITQELTKIKGNVETKNKASENWSKVHGIIENYYSSSYVVNSQSMFFNSKLLEDAKKFDRNFVISELAKRKQTGIFNEKDATTEKILNDYSNFLNKSGVIDDFLQKIDEALPRTGSTNPVATIKKVEEIKQLAEALYAFVGKENTDVTNIIKVADRIIQDQQEKMGSAITSDFHKKHLGNIIFSSQPFIIGSEKESDIKTVFIPGEPIYGIVYFGRSLSDMLKTVNFTKNGVTNFDFHIYKNGNTRVSSQAEKWEIDSYAFHDDITIHRNQMDQSYIQFILIPKSSSELLEYSKAHNYSPVIFSRMLASQAPRETNFKISFSHVDYNGFNQIFEGNFKVDLSQGEGPKYYERLQNQLIDKYIEDNELPNAGMKNSTLEQQMIEEMNSKGWQEQFVKAIIEQKNWTIEKNALGQPVRKIINAFMVAKHPDGYCFYHSYGFESRPTGNGWSAPQYRSSGSRTRILCEKL